MAKIIILCTLANCAAECNGIKFAPSDDPAAPGMLSEPVEQSEAIDRMLTIPGFSVYEKKRQAQAGNTEREDLFTEARALGLSPSGNIGTAKLRELIAEEKQRQADEAAAKAAENDTSTGGEGSDSTPGDEGQDTMAGGEGGAGIF